MAHGLLEVKGTIDLAQFWPNGQSDADTVKVLLADPNAFKFQAQPGAPFKATQAFEGATVKGKVTKPAIDKQRRITIRLQGIDAPELHYRPTAPTLNKKTPTPAQRAKFNAANGNFRQNFGETATVALHDFLSKAGGSPIACVVRTAVDQPSDVFDTFGRFIGNIFVTVAGKEQDANLWLCANGWVFPTFYVTMSAQEIDDVTTRCEAARKKKLGIWKNANSNLKPFDRKLLFRNHGPANPAGDVGPVIMPKLFRRRSTFGIAQTATIAGPGPFKNYLQAEPDACFETRDFLGAGHSAATPRRLDEFVTPGGVFTVGAKDLVFQESKSHVVDAKGKPVQW